MKANATSDCGGLSIPAAATDAGMDAATEVVSSSLNVKLGHSSEGQLKDQKVNDCDLDSLWQNTTAASLWLDLLSAPETRLEINPLSSTVIKWINH